MIGIIIAMHKESKKFIKKIKNKKYKFIKNKKIILGYINKKKIIFIKSGIGKVFSSIATTLIIKKFKIKYIINIGTSGSLKKKINYQDLIICNKIRYHDVNITKFGYKLGQIPKTPKYFKTKKSIIKKIKKKIQKYKTYIGELISGDKFINKYKNIKKKFPNALNVDMEGAAIAQTCFFFKIPLICIKIISDKSNKNSQKNFYKYINNISNKINKILHLII